MTDKNTPEPTDAERRLAYEWAKSVEANLDTWGGRLSAPARVILNAVPDPPLPTMADMSMEERHECRWMQCDAGSYGRRGLIVGTGEWAVYVADKETGIHSNYSPDLVTARPDLPRMEWNGTEKAEDVPALPGDWRLANHPDHRRVIVTTQTPDRDGYVYVVIPDAGNFRGYDWHFCDPDKLTYLDSPNTKEDDQ